MTIFRFAIRCGLGGTFWIIKSLMLLAAFTALIFWPASRGNDLAIGAERSIMHPLPHYIAMQVGVRNGRVLIQSDWRNYLYTPRSFEWTFRKSATPAIYDDSSLPSTLGPLRWAFARDNDPDFRSLHFQGSSPIWLFAFATGTWPMASLIMLSRRRAKQKRMQRIGRCPNCGYDVRATPQNGGALLERCPECGETTADRAPLKSASPTISLLQNIHARIQPASRKTCRPPSV